VQPLEEPPPAAGANVIDLTELLKNSLRGKPRRAATESAGKRRRA
jgi:non-homologous end joining protein Ku